MDSRGKAFQREEIALVRLLWQGKKNVIYSKKREKGHWNKMRGKVIQN